MKKLLIYLKDYKKETVFAPLFKLLEALFELFVPLVMAAIIDNGIDNKDTSYILKYGGVLVLLGVVGLVASITAQFFAAKAAVGFSTKLRHSLFEHITGFSFTEIDNVGSSTMITRLTSDINQLQNGVNMVLRLFLRSPFIVGGAMVMAFTIDIKASLIFLLVIPALTLVVCGIMKITIPMYKKVQGALDSVLLSTRENIEGVRVIRAFNQEQDEIVKFDEKNIYLKKLQISVGKISGLMNPFTYAIVNCGIVVLVWKGAVFVDGGILTQGQVIALINYMSQILVELIKLANLIVTITKSLASANRISEVFDITNSDTTGKHTSWKNEGDIIVEFENAGLLYSRSKEEALSNITFKVKKGETVGIIGGTGCGKTSLVHMITGFYQASKGCVKVAGVDIKDWDSVALRENIGIVMQKAVLFAGSIKENLLWGSENNTEEELKEYIKISQSEEFVSKKQGEMEYQLEQGGKNLSGGQRQRLTIARALARKPKILILDASSSALDFATDAKLRKDLKEYKKDTTVFIVSSRTSSILHADKIIVLDDGEIVGIDTHDNLLKNCDIYREIHNIQVNGGES